MNLCAHFLQKKSVQKYFLKINSVLRLQDFLSKRVETISKIFNVFEITSYNVILDVVLIYINAIFCLFCM